MVNQEKPLQVCQQERCFFSNAELLTTMFKWTFPCGKCLWILTLDKCLVVVILALSNHGLHEIPQLETKERAGELTGWWACNGRVTWESWRIIVYYNFPLGSHVHVYWKSKHNIFLLCKGFKIRSLSFLERRIGIGVATIRIKSSPAPIQSWVSSSIFSNSSGSSLNRSRNRHWAEMWINRLRFWLENGRIGIITPIPQR